MASIFDTVSKVVFSKIPIEEKESKLVTLGLSQREINAVLAEVRNNLKKEEGKQRLAQRIQKQNRNKSTTSNGLLKCLAIRQPWATLIAYGIKDVECRNEMVPPCNRFLIAASGTKEPWDILGPDEEAIVREYQAKGVLPPYKEWPTSAIIGYVDIDRVTYDPVDSIWAADWPGIKYVLKNAHVFREPIRGKNKGTPFFYNVEGIDEENMPEVITVNFER